jgi:hypothetical protein
MKESIYQINGEIVVGENISINTGEMGMFDIEHNGITKTQCAAILQSIKETGSIPTSIKEASTEVQGIASQLISKLLKVGIAEESRDAEYLTGIEALLIIEDCANRLLYDTLYENPFWKACANARTLADLPENVIYGLVIENYHFLFRESYFDAPVLSYTPSTRARLKMNEFFAEEYGHDELILKGLTSIGITRDALAHTVPLPETMALCNSLASWAHDDPIFFFSTLGVLEGKDLKVDSFVEAAERVGISSAFIGPVRAHSKINLEGGHGNLTREIFRAIPAIPRGAINDLIAKTQVFVELYDSLYSGIWDYYSTITDAKKLLRIIK